MEGAARRVLDALDEAGVEQTALVGYSMGGRLALYLALEYPERFDSLILESASPGLRTERERTARRRYDEELARRLDAAGAADFRAFLEVWHRQPLFVSLAGHEGLLEKLITDRTRNDPKELARSLRGMGTGSQPSLWEDLPNLKVPTLAVAGEYDEKFVGIAREMSETSRKIECVVVAGAGHNVHAERPGEFVRLLKRFVGDG